MNESNAIHEVQFVFRRLSESLRIAGKEIDGYFWLAVLIPVLILAVLYVVWMYRRDSKSVGWKWATFLGLLRCGVYATLAWVFLLPGEQSWDTTESRSKVIVLFDVSGSMASKDDLPTDTVPFEKLLGRQDKVIRFLTNDQVGFLKRLQQKNPVTLYRFGGRLDEKFENLDSNAPWTAEQWNNWLKLDPRAEIPKDLDEPARGDFVKKLELHAQLSNGTNLGDSLLGTINREANNMLQGIVVVSDGRSTQFSGQTFEELRHRAEKSGVKIFTVAVGEQRQRINIRITDLLVPEQARPDDKFRALVEIDGEGLADKDVDVSLDITKPNGEKVTLKPDPKQNTKFKPGEPPHAQVEFEIDRPEIEGEWKFVVRVPKDKREAFPGKEHMTDPATVQVIKKPMRVLLFAGGPTRDYQFARALFVREVDRKRAELSVFLQIGRPDIVQDVPADRLLKRFPGTFSATDAGDKGEDRYDNLAQYDLIVAFDPDWTQLLPEQIQLLEKWVEEGGGLVVVGGPVNTFQLKRGVNYEKVKPILDLYPVLLEDSRLQGLGIERPATEPWRLHFPGANAEMEFLNLDDENKEMLSGWEEFFTGTPRGEAVKNSAAVRGFFNYYPVTGIKPGATVIGTFADPRSRLPDGKEQPYLVSMPYKTGKIVYLGSGEVWRLRQYREAFHERFWTKLARYAGSGNTGQLKQRGVIVMGRTYTANNYVNLEARLRGRDMQPLARTEKPKIQIKAPAGASAPKSIELQPKSSASSGWDGWFQGRFLVMAPGNYELQLPVPGTSDVLTSKFVVKEANPEMDNTTPDFGQLRLVAGDAAEVLSRIQDAERAKVLPELERTNKLPVKEGSVADEKELLKLYFDMKAAEVIPNCMITDRKIQRTRGPIKDLWDGGFVIRDGEPPIKVSYVLLLVVGLLSVEWLTRKLLKLA